MDSVNSESTWLLVLARVRRDTEGHLKGKNQLRVSGGVCTPAKDKPDRSWTFSIFALVFPFSIGTNEKGAEDES